MQTLDERKFLKNNDTEEIKKMIFRGLVEIDDPIDLYSKHTILHDAVMLNRGQLVDFLLN